MDPTTVSDIEGGDGSVPTMRAVVISEFGGPEVMQLVEDAPQPEPAEGQVLVKVNRAGINFADTHARENSYLSSYELPLIPGGEVAGEVDGQRVVALTGTGGYAEYALAPEQAVFPLPDGVSDTAALAVIIQGLSAWHLLKTSSHMAEGESVVVHAAAGGVGSLAVQLAKRYGAGRVIATASSEEKRALALELGADIAIDANEDDLKAALREANGGAKVDIVLEMAGGRVFDQSLRALAPFGRLVTYGQASREPNTVASGALMARSQAVVGFWLVHCFGRPPAWSPSRCRSCSGWSPPATSAWSRAASTGSPRPRRPTRTCRRGRRAGSSCSTPPARRRLHDPRPYGPFPPRPHPMPAPGTRPGPNPATRMRSPTVRYGPPASRSSTIRRAPTGPMPGSCWSSAARREVEVDAVVGRPGSGGGSGSGSTTTACGTRPKPPGR